MIVKSNNQYIKTYTVLVTIILIVMSSCRKDFEEINKNPNGFTSASDGSLFNAALRSLQPEWNEQLYVNLSVLQLQTQQIALPQVRWVNYTLGTEAIWNNYYTTLPILRELDKRINEQNISQAETKNMQAMMKVVLALKTFKVSDLFGDIPYSEAGYGFQDATQTHPKFDSQQEIYKSLLDELKWCQDNINDTAVNRDPFLTFKKFDNLFYGDMKKWRKLTNSLRLRYAMRMVNKEPISAAQIIKDIIENNLPCLGINEFGQLVNDPQNETAAIWPFKLGYRNESKGWAYNQSKDARMGSNMWRLLANHDSVDGSGIYDPRAYYFFETNVDNKWVPYHNDPANGIPDGGIPYDYQRDIAYAVKGTDCKFSPVNYYLVRDMDYQPEIIISGAEVLFLRAEAYMRGIGVAKDEGLAATAFLDGIQSSLSFWQYAMTNSKLPLGATFATNINVPANLDFFSVQNNLSFWFGNSQQKLEEIYEQSYIDFFRQPQEAFALARRTMATPRQGNAPLNVFRFPIPPTELSYNLASWNAFYGSSGNSLTQKVWWMN